MIYMNDSIDWIGAKEDSMRKYEEEEKKLAAREAIIDMAKGLGKVEGKDGNNA